MYDDDEDEDAMMRTRYVPAKVGSDLRLPMRVFRRHTHTHHHLQFPVTFSCRATMNCRRSTPSSDRLLTKKQKPPFWSTHPSDYIGNQLCGCVCFNEPTAFPNIRGTGVNTSQHSACSHHSEVKFASVKL